MPTHHTHPAENDRYGFLSSDGYPEEGPNPLIKPPPSAENDAAGEQVSNHVARVAARDRACYLGCSCGWRPDFTAADLRPSAEQWYAHLRPIPPGSGSA